MKVSGLEKKIFFEPESPEQIFFDEQALQKTTAALKKTYPIIQEKKVILYAPTYRENQFNVSSVPLDIEEMYQELKVEYILLLRLHPAAHFDFT
ncbi:CDP-glycerol glycerophosphotransferase family protein [Bacillus norwichensis]|uniref:CDP-glycerol glycerophosphotransferase family protein n=1 Tax=Bacillus norwichensis TaxID=2762217 RepID=A0ABR8VI49_9BACI|nr:CDP-glycerol glycerophosphotransferase family protein [Bacillus norwichensis]MBD8004286.1 CDP-glycerol glycerophosphotransferase family protein [Bacillus norwichensis]